nr:chemosensory protein [Lasioderma serricorne]
MRTSLPIICALASFVLMYDNQKIVVAKALQERGLTRRAVDKYTTKYDNIDIDRIVNSRRLLQNYVNCLLDKGPCTPEGKELKTYLPEALATDCAKCSDAQKKFAGKVFTHLLQNHRDFWNALLAKYDPEGNFRKKYEGENEDYSDYDES